MLRRGLPSLFRGFVIIFSAFLPWGPMWYLCMSRSGTDGPICDDWNSPLAIAHTQYLLILRRRSAEGTERGRRRTSPERIPPVSITSPQFSISRLVRSAFPFRFRRYFCMCCWAGELIGFSPSTITTHYYHYEGDAAGSLGPGIRSWKSQCCGLPWREPVLITYCMLFLFAKIMFINIGWDVGDSGNG